MDQRRQAATPGVPGPSGRQARRLGSPRAPAAADDEVKNVDANAQAPRGRLGPLRSAKTTGEATVAGVRLTHADRILYPPHGTTKLDLARFYESIAKWILPHLEDRPTTLVRCPEGAHKTCFYQKHVGYWAPESLRRVKIQEKRKVGEYLVVDSLASLIGLVQIGILEIHTWNSVVKRLEQPDRVVFDLDPGPGVEWAQVDRVRPTSSVTRSARLELESFVKTTGGKGLHVVAPLVPGPSWDETSAFAREPSPRPWPAPIPGATSRAWRRRSAGQDLHRLSAQYPRGHERRRLLHARHAAERRCPCRSPGTSCPPGSRRIISRSRTCQSGWPGSPRIPGRHTGAPGSRFRRVRQRQRHALDSARDATWSCSSCAIPCASGHESAVEKALRDVIGPFERRARLLEHRCLSLDPRSPAVLHPLALEGRGGVRDPRRPCRIPCASWSASRR